MNRLFVIVPLLLSLGGCSTFSGWFTDEEELKIRQLKPIEAEFQGKVLWQDDIGDGVGIFFSRLKPAVGYNKVFAANRTGLVKAYDQKSGKTLWQKNIFNLNSGGFFSGMFKKSDSAKIAGGLVLAYQKVYFGTENGDVVALNEQTGDIAWQVEVKGEVIAAPAVDAGLVVVNTSSGVLFALDAETGVEKWRYESDVPPLSLRGVSQPNIAGGGVMVGTATGKLAVAIAETGQVAWEQAIASPTGATELDRIADIDIQPLILGGTVFTVSFDGTLAAVEMRSGRIIWKREYKSYRRLSSDANNLFLVDNDSVVYALDRRNGVELWSQSSLQHRLLTGASPVANYLVVGDKFGFIHWLNQSDGKIVARLALGDDDEDESIYASPVVDGKVLYTQTRDGVVFAVETP